MILEVGCEMIEVGNDTVDGSEIRRTSRLVVYPINKVLYISGGAGFFHIFSINSSMCQQGLLCGGFSMHRFA